MDKMLLATFDQMRPSSNVASEKEITENVCVVGGPRERQIRTIHCHGFTSLFLYLVIYCNRDLLTKYTFDNFFS